MKSILCRALAAVGLAACRRSAATAPTLRRSRCGEGGDRRPTGARCWSTRTVAPFTGSWPKRPVRSCALATAPGYGTRCCCPGALRRLARAPGRHPRHCDETGGHTHQVTCNAQPLCTYTVDRMASVVAGQGVASKCFAVLALTAPACNSHATTATPTASPSACRYAAACGSRGSGNDAAGPPPPQLRGHSHSCPAPATPGDSATSGDKAPAPSFNDGDLDNPGGPNDGDGNGDRQSGAGRPPPSAPHMSEGHA